MPGTYKTTGAPSDSSMGEYWERAKNDSQSLDSIIGNDYFKGPGKMTVKVGEVVSVSGGATWTRVSK